VREDEVQGRAQRM